MAPEHLAQFHALTSNNRSLLAASGEGACISCGTYLDFHQDIVEWCDGGQTAICPRCGVDAVLPTVTPMLLGLMHRHYFGPVTAKEAHA